MRCCGRSLRIYGPLRNASKKGNRVQRQHIRAKCQCFYQKLDSRFRRNDTPSIVLTQVGIKSPWSRRLSLCLFFAFFLLSFVFSSFVLAAPHVYVTNEK